MLIHKFAPALSPAMIVDVHTELEPLGEVIRNSPIQRYRSGDTIFAQGERKGSLCLVEYGSVRVGRITPEGRRHISGFQFGGDVFGFEGADEHRQYAEAIEPSGIRMLRLRETDYLSKGVLGLMFGYYERVQEHLVALGTQGSLERVAAFLIGLAERQDANHFIRLPMSRGDIADHLGLTIETVSRALHRLVEFGYIELLSARKVRIRDRQAMEAMGQ